MEQEPGGGPVRDSSPAYLPALRFRRLTRFYDRVVAALLPEDRLKRRLVSQAGMRSGHRVLDLGCGTATLTLLAQGATPGAVVVGLDADLEALALARRKAAAAGAGLRVCAGVADALPFRDGSFDRVLSSLFFHHLDSSTKRSALGAIVRTLDASGELHVLDWGKAQDAVTRVAFLAVQLLDGFATTAESVRGRLVERMREAGLPRVEETHRERSLFGTLELYQARLAPTSTHPERGRGRTRARPGAAG